MIKELYFIFEEPDKHSLGKSVNLFIFTLVIISTFAFYMSTVKELAVYQNVFDLVEVITMSFFTLELILRFISIGYNENYQGFIGKLKFIKNPFVLIDIAVVAGFYLSLFGIDFVFLRVLRLLRIFKLFRHSKYDEFDDTLIEIFQENKSKFVVILLISSILVFVTAPIMYYIENPAQPDVFSSIPAALWWTTVTFTTVGYGDMFPITSLGKILATVVSVLGIAFYAIPGAIFTSSLLDKLNKRNK